MKIILFLLVWLLFSPLLKASENIRIVTLAPSLTEMVYSAGAGDLLVGVVSYSDYPKEALSLPLVGNYKTINMEQIIHLNPTLILAWESGNTLKDIQQLRKLGYPVVVTEIKNLADIPNQIEKIGQLTHRQTTAKQMATKLRAVLLKLKKQQPKTKPTRTFYQVWDKPLYTINGKQFIGQGITLCGGKNIFENLPALAPQVSIESVIQHDPELILLGSNKNVQQNWRKSWQQYPVITAVKNNRISSLEASLYQRPTARFINALPALCRLIKETLNN